MKTHRTLLAVAATFFLMAHTAQAHAQETLKKEPIRLVVAFPAGGAVDLVGRLLADALGPRLGVPMVVENKPGFSGNIGALDVVRSKPNGHTLLVAPLTSYAISEAVLGSETGYSLKKDFVAVSAVGQVPFFLAVNAQLPIKTMKDYYDLAKSKPDHVTYGSSGNGSTEQVVAALFQLSSQVSMLHIPYKGGVPAMTDLMGGQIMSIFATSPNVVQNVPGGKIKALAITTKQRSPALPDVPTTAEAGFPEVEAASIYAVLAPRGTPAAIVEQLNKEIVAAVNTPEVQAKLRRAAIEPYTWSPAEADTLMKADIDKWSNVVKKANIVR